MPRMTAANAIGYYTPNGKCEKRIRLITEEKRCRRDPSQTTTFL
jgi:hypothetical protein